MHHDDQMTPQERARALKNGLAVDRLPIGMIYDIPSSNLLGWTRRYGCATARRSADRIKEVYNVFGIDGIGVPYGLHGVGRALGAEMSNPEHSAPAILSHPLKNIEDLSGLDLEKVSVKQDPDAKMCYETVQILKDELGHEVGCGFCLPGVFTAASSLAGPPQLLRAIRRKPEAVHKLLAFVTAALLQLAKPFLEIDVPINVADPVASGTLISSTSFDEFVQPYAKQFVDGCNAIRDFGVSAHICGDTTKVLSSIANCGYNNIDIDNAVDLVVAKERVGSVVHISGNVSPTGVLLLGTPNEVEDAVKECFLKAWNSPCGFTITTGCDTAYGTPLENSLAFVAAARRCAKTPVNLENFI